MRPESFYLSCMTTWLGSNLTCAHIENLIKWEYKFYCFLIYRRSMEILFWISDNSFYLAKHLRIHLSFYPVIIPLFFWHSLCLTSDFSVQSFTPLFHLLFIYLLICTPWEDGFALPSICLFIWSSLSLSYPVTSSIE